MKIEDVRLRARALGLTGISRIKKAHLIRIVQEKEGHQSCFGASWRFDCRVTDCCWRPDCRVRRPG